MLTIWGRKSSFNVQKVLWLADELGMPYHHVPAGGIEGSLNTVQYVAMNPTRRIPLIQWEGTPIWESHVILRALAALDPQRRFWSDDPVIRSQAERWMDWGQTALEPDLMTGLFWELVRTPQSQRDWSVIKEKIQRCEQHFFMLDDVLRKQPYLSGDRFGLGDIPVGASLFRYFTMDIERPDLPHVRNWYQQLQSRPAYRTNVMVSYETLRGVSARPA